MIRTILLSAATAALMVLSAAPAFAGPTETAFLQKLGASWTGKGKLTGAQTGQVSCRIVITAKGQSAKYQGRCTIPDLAAQAFNGSITYNDKLKRYESRTMNGVVPGIKRGSSLVFTDSRRSMQGTSYSQMTISASSLVVTFTLVDKDGEKTKSTVSFTKS